MRRLYMSIFLVGAALTPGGAEAQEGPPPETSFESELFTAELIMQHRRAIDLTDEQRDAITRMIEQLQGKVVGLQWRLLDEMESLKEVLASSQIDQDRAFDRLENVLEIENEVKRAHLELLIRMKNVLTPQQQRELERLRDQGPGEES